MNLRHIVVIGIYVCLCLKSTDGRHIRETGLKSTDGRHKRETGPCNPNPCQNDGTCTVDGTDYTCNCTRHFVGRDCEIYQIFCLNGGSCTVDGKDYTWNCTSPFGGINCETEGLKSTDGRHKRETGPCDPNPCQNGGTCTVDGTDYTCNCTSQFRGRDCESTGQCSTGWHIYGDKCFLFSSSTKTWEAANTLCVNDHSGYLAEIFSANENNFLEYTGKKISTLTTGVWFGLKWHNGEDTFHWVTSGTLYNYRNWLGGTGTGFSNVYCYKFDQSNGLWSQLDCSTSSNYICEKAATDDPCTESPCKNGGTCTSQSGSYTCTCSSQFVGTNCEQSCPSGWSLLNGRCYIYKNGETVNWSTAKSKCAQDGGTLAQADSEAVNNYLDTFKGNGDTAWIGLNDLETENTFKWTGSQQPVSYTNWNTYEPNNGAGTGEEDCVEMSDNKKWNDYYCASLKFYFCQRSPTIAP